MNESNTALTRFDAWIKDESDVAALVMRQWLESVEGKDAVIFPPTYPIERDPVGYNIDYFGDGSNVCQIDSVGSQANRMEPVFRRSDYKHLVPQVSVKVGDHCIHILEAGHRAADAIVRFASEMEGKSNSISLGKELWDAFIAFDKYGDAEPLAKIAPTTCIFGAWDSRATQAKLPRIVRSVVRAYNVKLHTRSAQYNPPIHYVNQEIIEERHNTGSGENNPLSAEGFRDNPATGKHGGVTVTGEIRRDASISLVALRNLGVTPRELERDEDVNRRLLRLRRYILGLALVALTHRSDQMFNLREGCLLRISRPSEWELVPFEGEKEDVLIGAADALSYANETADDFGVQQFDSPFLFDVNRANKWVSMSRSNRDRARRRGPVVKQDM